MEITHVSYERKQADGNYGNTMMGASAILCEGDDPAAALDALRTLVGGKLAEQNEAERQREQIEEDRRLLDHDIAVKTRQLEELRQKWQAARAFLEQAGVNVEDRYGDAPF